VLLTIMTLCCAGQKEREKVKKAAAKEKAKKKGKAKSEAEAEKVPRAPVHQAPDATAGRQSWSWLKEMNKIKEATAAAAGALVECGALEYFSRLREQGLVLEQGLALEQAPVVQTAPAGSLLVGAARSQMVRATKPISQPAVPIVEPKFVGVTWITKSRKWRASLSKNGRTNNLGLFEAAEDAAQAYDSAARRLRGKAAHGARIGNNGKTRLNFPTEEERLHSSAGITATQAERTAYTLPARRVINSVPYELSPWLIEAVSAGMLNADVLKFAHWLTIEPDAPDRVAWVRLGARFTMPTGEQVPWEFSWANSPKECAEGTAAAQMKQCCHNYLNPMRRQPRPIVRYKLVTAEEPVLRLQYLEQQQQQRQQQQRTPPPQQQQTKRADPASPVENAAGAEPPTNAAATSEDMFSSSTSAGATKPIPRPAVQRVEPKSVGVSWNGYKWHACISNNWKSNSLGQFDAAEDAARAYDAAARRLRGEAVHGVRIANGSRTARLNFPTAEERLLEHSAPGASAPGVEQTVHTALSAVGPVENTAGAEPTVNAAPPPFDLQGEAHSCAGAKPVWSGKWNCQNRQHGCPFLPSSFEAVAAHERECTAASGVAVALSHPEHEILEGPQPSAAALAAAAARSYKAAFCRAHKFSHVLNLE
jgi:hypothetical protein